MDYSYNNSPASDSNHSHNMPKVSSAMHQYHQSFLQNTSSNIPSYNSPTITPAAPTYTRPMSYQQSDPRFKANQASSPVEALDQKSDDELWIETYLSKIGKIKLSLQSNIEIITKKPAPPPSMSKKTLKLHIAKSLLHRCIALLGELQKLEDYLRQNVATISSAEWKEKTVEIGQQKDEFTSLLSQFEDPSVLDQLRKAINKRKRKRISQKRKKIARKEEHEETLKNRRAQHDVIDNWLEKMKEDAEKAKKEDLLKKDTDCILAEVTKKKSDARKHLNTLSSLVKLRAVRETAALGRGEKISLEDSNAFKVNTGKCL